MPAAVQLVLDLGDLLTKGLAVQGGRRKRLRFPSVVARRLIDENEPNSQLVLDEGVQLQRLSGFDPRNYPRTRSYPTAQDALAHADPVAGARFAGWLAARLGADRRLLGSHPDRDIIDALIRKALIQLNAADFDCREVHAVLVVDLGAKAEALIAYAQDTSCMTLRVHNIRHSQTRRVDVQFRFQIVDAAECAARALPAPLQPPEVEEVLLVDIGYLRSKLAVLAPLGCVAQQQADGLGVSDCVRRLLRDEQEHGLIEDELAVVRALERSQDVLAVAGRQFQVGATFASARRALAEELAAAARRLVLGHYESQGHTCSGLAVIGGGATLLGQELAECMTNLDLGLDRTWVADDPGFTLLEAAFRARFGERNDGDAR